MATPALTPRLLARSTSRRGLAGRLDVEGDVGRAGLDEALEVLRRIGDHQVNVEIARGPIRRIASTTKGPMVMLGTKWPSITSTCSISTPASSTAAIAPLRSAKSADSSDGAILTQA